MSPGSRMPSYSFYPIDEPGIVAAESLFTLASPRRQEDVAFIVDGRAFRINSRLPFSSVLEPRPMGFTLIEDDSDSFEVPKDSESTRRGFPHNKRSRESTSSCEQELPNEYDVRCKRQRTSSLFDYKIDGNLPGVTTNANRRPSVQGIIGGMRPFNMNVHESQL